MPSPATRSGRRLSSVRAITLGLAALGLGATLFAPSASAQRYARTTTLSAFGGYNVASDLFESNYNSVNSATLELKNAFMWGGRLTKFTNEYSAVEFAYTRNTTEMEVHNYGGTLPAGFSPGRMDSDQYDLNFLASQPSINPNMWPYFTLGFGWTVTHPQVNALDPAAAPIKVDGNNLFAFNFGLGTATGHAANPDAEHDSRAVFMRGEWNRAGFPPHRMTLGKMWCRGGIFPSPIRALAGSRPVLVRRTPRRRATTNAWRRCPRQSSPRLLMTSLARSVVSRHGDVPVASRPRGTASTGD